MSTAAASGLAYLTVQDMLWINLQVTGVSAPFDYAKLEEATFTQYGYGSSNSPLKQAGAFLKGFAKIAPLSQRNQATSFIGFRAFLEMNGYDFNLPDAEAAAWTKRILSGEVDAISATEKLASFDAHGHSMTPQEALNFVIESYPLTIANLD